MLYGCGQDADSFAASTRMNRVASRQGFIVLYRAQDRLANAQGCRNWFDIASGCAFAEATSILAAIEQVTFLYPANRTRVAVAGLSAGASMAALLAMRHPDRFKALLVHSGAPPGVAHSTLSAFSAMQGRRAAKALPANQNRCHRLAGLTAFACHSRHGLHHGGCQQRPNRSANLGPSRRGVCRCAPQRAARAPRASRSATHYGPTLPAWPGLFRHASSLFRDGLATP